MSSCSALLLLRDVRLRAIYYRDLDRYGDGPSGAVVPQAKVNLKNEGSGDLRRTVSNSDGFFTFAAVPAGIYEVTIEAPGFLNYQISGSEPSGSERRNLDVDV